MAKKASKPKWTSFVKFGAGMIATMLILGGCGTSQIFENKDEKYQLVALSDKELSNDVYYVKEGTRFYASYMPENNGLSSTNGEVSPDRFAWLKKDYSLLPTLYKDEVIAYAASDYEVSGIVLERLQYMGYSMGIYGGSFNSEGYYEFKTTDGLINKSDAQTVFAKYASNTIKIISVDGEPVSDKMVNATGFFTGMEEDSYHTLEIFAGTKYDTVKIQADYMYFISYEAYNVNSISTTKNGYVAIKMPEGAKSGFYVIDGQGMFKYCDFKKGEESEDKILSNESYYQTEEEKLSLYSQQYAINIKKTTKNVGFTVEYNEGTVDKDSIFCVLLAPDGTRYVMKAGDNRASIMLDTATAGRWTLNISPKNLEVTNIDVSGDGLYKDAYSVEYWYEVKEPETNMEFWATYIGYGNIWGTVENEDSETQEMHIVRTYETETDDDGTVTETKGLLSVVYPYLAAGKYKMTIYHYEDTAIDEDGLRAYTGNLDQDVITIEE